MGFFNRQPRAVDGTAPPVATDGTHGHHTTHKERKARRHGFEPYTMTTRPTFGQWLKYTWLDVLTMAILGAIGLGVYYAHPAPSRSFAVQFSDGEVVYPQFAYPMRKEIIPIWLAAFLASMIPIFIILCMQIRIRSFWDVNNGILGLLYSLITAAVFQVFIKWLIGGLRPHFLTVCQPDISRATNTQIAQAGYSAQGFAQIYYTKDICTGNPDEIDDSLESMPSGHSTAAFAGFIFLALYLNAKLKVFSNYHPALWKLAAVYAPVLGACLIAGALTIDEFHHWYDVLAGAVIGTVMAFSAYRMVYASIWDWRYNHIPLNRSNPFPYGSRDDMELGGATFTRQVGWGTSGAGFPFDDKHGYAGGGYGGHGGYGGGGSAINRKPVAGDGVGGPFHHNGVRGEQMV
ncbi:phosphatidic acid phosphatase [Pseudoneurospora amorphoporcata]|uniref:Phosphatidic acid phosphatase n=1 Tax=Pseudoneurospora amorphoporcata TaxID=241081 RepID=A0AAN6SJ04_9PEZI|nr:phosphatidic acid phosphatase [Pseudoneurospora amorphoporcata]